MNKSRNVLTDFVVWSMIVSAILVLTRPGSQGPGLVNAFTGGYAKIVQAVTGQRG